MRSASSLLSFDTNHLGDLYIKEVSGGASKEILSLHILRDPPDEHQLDDGEDSLDESRNSPRPVPGNV